MQSGVEMEVDLSHLLSFSLNLGSVQLGIGNPQAHEKIFCGFEVFEAILALEMKSRLKHIGDDWLQRQMPDCAQMLGSPVVPFTLSWFWVPLPGNQPEKGALSILWLLGYPGLAGASSTRKRVTTRNAGIGSMRQGKTIHSSALRFVILGLRTMLACFVASQWYRFAFVLGSGFPLFEVPTPKLGYLYYDMAVTGLPSPRGIVRWNPKLGDVYGLVGWWGFVLDPQTGA